jgi:hypothetical protein
MDNASSISKGASGYVQLNGGRSIVWSVGEREEEDRVRHIPFKVGLLRDPCHDLPIGKMQYVRYETSQEAWHRDLLVRLIFGGQALRKLEICSVQMFEWSTRLH